MTPDELEARGRILLALARMSIEQALGGPAFHIPSDPWLQECGATFVTLYQGQRLHGCVGSIEPTRRLGRDVTENAVAAALRDPRSRPLVQGDLAGIRIEVSELSPLRPIAFTSEYDALGQLQPHLDGVVLAWGVQRATFLPQVWAQLPAPQDFIRELKVKAGLQAEFWAPDLELFRYSLVKWSERAPSSPPPPAENAQTS